MMVWPIVHVYTIRVGVRNKSEVIIIIIKIFNGIIITALHRVSYDPLVVVMMLLSSAPSVVRNLANIFFKTTRSSTIIIAIFTTK